MGVPSGLQIPEAPTRPFGMRPIRLHFSNGGMCVQSAPSSLSVSRETTSVVAHPMRCGGNPAVLWLVAPIQGCDWAKMTTKEGSSICFLERFAMKKFALLAILLGLTLWIGCAGEDTSTPTTTTPNVTMPSDTEPAPEGDAAAPEGDAAAPEGDAAAPPADAEASAPDAAAPADAAPADAAPAEAAPQQ